MRADLEPYESFWHETQRAADAPYFAAVLIGCVLVAVLMFSAGFLVGRDVYMAPSGSASIIQEVVK